ncbi:hypothetical protein PsYK624_166440 [Phanerochaete sordida]|uniref:Uncharacterized protein n=1 Tax=Phanerochaete sordida TaxID=48140 RepID=A0A9P3GRV3_9APHY|nr:hypothetical protein PsYK624_166440 [Phanerochaete sordida]
MKTKAAKKPARTSTSSSEGGTPRNAPSQHASPNKTPSTLSLGNRRGAYSTLTTIHARWTDARRRHRGPRRPRPRDPTRPHGLVALKHAERLALPVSAAHLDRRRGLLHVESGPSLRPAFC